MDQGVVAFGQQPEKLAFGADSVPAGAQEEHAVPLQVLPILHAGSRIEIFQQLGPITSVDLPQQVDQSPTLAAGGSLIEGHLEQNGIPPTNLVVAVIADHTRVVAQFQDLIARNFFHSVYDLWVPHVPPRGAGRGPDVQHRRERYIPVLALSECLEIAPAANRREAPGLQALQRRLGPSV